MSITNTQVTAYMDDYYEKRPQLKRPKQNILGYQVPSSLNPVLNSMMAELIRLRRKTIKGKTIA